MITYLKKFFIMEKTLYQLINTIFFFVFLYVAAAVLFLAPLASYTCKKTFEFSNILLIAADILILFIAVLIYRKNESRIIRFTEKPGSKFILIGSVLLFFCQVFVSYHIYFLTGWDVGNFVIPAAKNMAAGLPTDDFNTYFSAYPNNAAIVWIYSMLFRLGGIFKVSGLFLIVVLNCFISSLSGFLTYKCVETMLNKRWALLSWLIFVCLIGTSPWVVITYSDSFVLFMPILLFYIYTRDLKGGKEGGHTALKWFLIGSVGFIGYHIKPQVIIVLIAIGIIELWRFFHSMRPQKRKGLFAAGSLLLAYCLSVVFSNMANGKFDLDKEQAFGITHFLMMGLNTDTDGVYSDEDVAFSGESATASERTKANMDVIKERLKSFTALGFVKFMTKKTLVNYNDGTFAWSAEGNFYMQMFGDKNPRLSPFLKSFFYVGGENYSKTATFEQMVWLAVIVSLWGLLFIKKDRMNSRIAVLMLAILGLTAFELLFEARARYLYSYAPLYICLSMLGLRTLISKCEKIGTNLSLKRNRETDPGLST